MVQLVADIGGTNARFATKINDNEVSAATTLACRDYADLESLLRAGFAALRVAPEEAAICVAGPVQADDLVLTNLKWSASIDKTRRALGLGRLMVLNDFEALAWSLPGLGPKDVQQIGPRVPADPAKARGILGPGTGLGMAGLIPTHTGWTAVIGEGGHMDFAPLDDLQADIWRELRTRFDHVSYERLLSGSGLVNLYEALCSIRGLPVLTRDPAEICEPDASAPAAESIAQFCCLLGAAAGNLALVLGAHGGVFVAGGIVPRMGPLFLAAEFRRGFEFKGRFESYMKAIPTWLVTASEPALRGLAAKLSHPD